jgi:apolipoprotein N-acyltransferase
MQSASLLGLYSITFLICLFASSVAMAARARREALPAVAFGVALCALNVLLGVVRLNQPQPATLGVAAVVDETAAAAAYHERTLAAAVNVSNTYASAIRSAAAQGAHFVVTPEGGFGPGFSSGIAVLKPQWRDAILAPLLAASQETGVQIIAGVYESDPPADLALSIAPDAPPHPYAKRHLIPLLEAQFTPGRDGGVLTQGRAMEICKDMDFPGTIRRDAAHGVQLMGVPAGDFVRDGWLHARIAIVRGIENGFAEVRAANDGLLTVTDAQGRIVARKTAAPAGTTLVVARVAPGPGPTLYTRIGDVFPWLCAVLTGLLALFAHVRRKAGTGAAEALTGVT